MVLTSVGSLTGSRGQICASKLVYFLQQILPCPFMWAGLHPKVWPRRRIGLPTSDSPIKKNPSQVRPATFEFELIPDVIKLTTKISHYNFILCQLGT